MGSTTKRGAILWAVLAALCVTGIPAPAPAQDTAGLGDDNARLRAENERLRKELGALRREAREAAGEAQAAAAEAAAPTGTGDTPSAGAATKATALEPEYIPATERISLSVTRDDAGAVSLLATPWHRTVVDTGLLPLRDFVQLRAIPERPGRPEQVWLSVYRQGVQRTVTNDTIGSLRVGDWSGVAPLAEHEITRRRKGPRHKGKRMPQRDEIAVFALPAGALDKLATAERATFSAGPIDFSFTDDHVSAASALAARMAREETPQ